MGELGSLAKGSESKPLWARLKKQTAMRNMIDHHQNISKEMDIATKKVCEAQHIMWREKSRAAREGRRPNKAIVEAYMRANGELEALSLERKLHAPLGGLHFPRPPVAPEPVV